MIEVSELTKYFGSLVVFNNFKLVINAPKVCLTAPNGRGKSTLFSLIAQLDPHYTGQITIDGTAQNRDELVALASDCMPFPPFLTAKQVLQLTQSSWGCQWPDSLIEAFYFTHFLNTKVSALSSGNLKKLQLINAMMRKTNVLLLDEPSAALDEASLKALLNWTNSYQGQLVISSHEPAPFLQQGFVLQALDGKSE